MFIIHELERTLINWYVGLREVGGGRGGGGEKKKNK